MVFNYFYVPITVFFLVSHVQYFHCTELKEKNSFTYIKITVSSFLVCIYITFLNTILAFCAFKSFEVMLIFIFLLRIITLGSNKLSFLWYLFEY